jgi:hypothetical protein
MIINRRGTSYKSGVEIAANCSRCFLWNSGTPDQKSQNGLLRFLIHELLSQHRKLISRVLPDQWHDEYVDPIKWQQDFQWSRDILKQAFNALRTPSQIRICLFIGDLDEYEGDKDGSYRDIVSFFTGLLDSGILRYAFRAVHG